LCYGTQSPDQFDITITAGQLSNYVDITTSSFVDCGQESTCQPETVSIDSYGVLTAGHSLCIIPTPTPTVTPTPTPTDSGDGGIGGGGSGGGGTGGGGGELLPSD
jgi:hypothetical protein